MKKIVSFFAIALCVGLLCACAQMLPANAMLKTANAQTQAVAAPESAAAAAVFTAEDAKRLALDKAGVNEADASRIHVKEDLEDGVRIYDVEFTADSTEYDYEISMSGEVLSMDIETGKGTHAVPGKDKKKETAPAKETDKQTNAPKPQKPTAADKPGAANAEKPEAKDENGYIGEEAAKKAALARAGLTEKDVTFGKVRLRRDDGAARYKITFYQGSTEYECKVDAKTGAVTEMDMESVADKGGKMDAPAQSANASYIGENAAKQAALAHAGVKESDAFRMTVEFDFEKGQAEYEVEWHVGNMEYNCEVNAVTGKIISFESEIDD